MPGDLFILVTALLAAGPAGPSAAESPKHAIDHVGLGVSDLDRGIGFVEEKTGVKAAKGGVHPGRGTQNALMSLGGGSYLEIIAPVPDRDTAALSKLFRLLALDVPVQVGGGPALRLTLSCPKGEVVFGP